ncbi:Nucleolar complex protein 2-like protein [Frankliniella fusca]|uniref:Nucleolar complex protein 2-like protein n=1 Tax=Frankliniella fusca TaxID=407009 RepID=A0AAE1HXM7_9NEOP|nr:Nucleolar complex protein 2-like protein [Frankliniella fusca]
MKMKKKASKGLTNSAKKQAKLKDMSVDDFMNSFGDSGSDSASGDEQDLGKDTKAKNGVLNGNGHLDTGSEEESGEEEESGDESGEDVEDSDAESSAEEEVDDESGEDEEVLEESDEGQEAADESGDEDFESGDENADDVSSDEEANGNLAVRHKKSLNKLKDIDPEFYKYLEENDKKLLQFNASDSEDSEGDAQEGDDDGEDGDEDDERLVHKPPSKLEVNSDESDFEGEDGVPSVRKSGVVTLKMIEKWRQSLQSDKSVQTISEVVQAFHAALQRVAPEEERSACVFKVEGGAVFNAVVQMCVLDLLPALRKYLNLTSSSLSYMNPVKCKRWIKVKTLIRSYSADLLQLLGGIASVNIITIVLKHLHQMTPFIICFPNVTKHFLKRMISLWSTGDETVRVVAFMCILRATTIQQKTLLDQVLRNMYMAYVKNTKFVSPNTLPGINFMRRSLSEIFLLDENVSYHHAFLYIRQLAIHLRNAITLQKKESIQAVYNWQFISSLALWGELLGASSKQALQPLLYPVVQVTVGAIKLVPTAQYYPLRFHCAQILINLSRSSGTFIPVLPFLLEILNSYNFNKKHSKVSMKPMDFSCILRLSKAQQQENGFKDAVIENIYSLMLESLTNEAHSIAFPDLALPAVVGVRNFLKSCKVANYTRKMKQILEKTEENIKFIENERKNVVINLSDVKAIQDWETAVKVKGTPLGAFYTSWKKMNTAKQTKLKKDTIDITENLPKIIRPKKKKSAEGPVELLPSDDSDSDNYGFGNDDSPKKARGKRGKKSKGQPNHKKAKLSEDINDDGADDVVRDVDLSDW